METVKFIQLHEKAQPISFDGIGYQFKFCDARINRKKDGTSFFIFFTGYRIEMPEGYFGQVYDSYIANVISGFRQQASQFITNKFPYEVEKDGTPDPGGLYFSYYPTGGVASVLWEPSLDYVGIYFSKIDGISQMNVEKNIIPIKKEEKVIKE